MDFFKLKTELQNVKYSAMSDGDAAIDLNALILSRNKLSLTGSQLLDAQDSAEYIALSDTKKSQWLALCGVESVDPFGSVVEIVKDTWGNGATTVSNLVALRVETISRATELGLPVLLPENIRFARIL